MLAHTQLFAAGIARSGAFNRTLTPFGFQGEERLLWSAPQAYSILSPFMHAPAIAKGPGRLLLIHGEADENSGTFPIQSERLFNALKGLGGISRLVLLPKEGHGYAARESILHVMAEQEDWLEKHIVKDFQERISNAKPLPPPPGDFAAETQFPLSATKRITFLVFAFGVLTTLFRASRLNSNL